MDLINLVQQTVLPVEQTNNTISYHRQLSTLTGAIKSSRQAKLMIKAKSTLTGAIKSSRQAKLMIKDKSTLLENSGKELFGQDFCDQITDTVKVQKQYKESMFNVFQQ